MDDDGSADTEKNYIYLIRPMIMLIGQIKTSGGLFPCMLMN